MGLPYGVVHGLLLLRRELGRASTAQMARDFDVLRGMFCGAQIKKRLLVDCPQSEGGLPESYNAGQA